MDAAEFMCLDDLLSGMLDKPCRLASPTDGGMKLCFISSHQDGGLSAQAIEVRVHEIGQVKRPPTELIQVPAHCTFPNRFDICRDAMTLAVSSCLPPLRITFELNSELKP